MVKEKRIDFTAVIGLEVHIQLSTLSKMFCSDATTFGAEPNVHVNTYTLAHPGTLPKLNRKAIDYGLKMGLACHCTINRNISFARKNYFYPDLPKGFQLTQDKTPIGSNGFLTFHTGNRTKRKIRLKGIHIEEDSGKSLHRSGEVNTFIDFNRAGIPLIEIVTEPDFVNGEEAASFLKEIRKTIRFLNISDGNMEEGSLRCDANVSITFAGLPDKGTKVEIKNMNSMRRIRDAIDYEIRRQVEVVRKGGIIVSETRSYNPDTGETKVMRLKEDMDDYRYFPEPDLSPIYISEGWLKDIKASMPTLPDEWINRLMKQYNLPLYHAEVLTETVGFTDYFCKICDYTQHYELASKILIGPVKSLLKQKGVRIEKTEVSPDKIGSIIEMIETSVISYSVAMQTLLPLIFERPASDPYALSREMNLFQVNDMTLLTNLIIDILEVHPEEVENYRKGKKGLLAMFMGKLMEKTSGKANPSQAAEIFKKQLDT